MTTLQQNKIIHGWRKALKQQSGGAFGDADYRALLVARFPGAFKSAPSSKELDADQAERLIGELKRLAGQTGAAPSGRRAADTVSGEWAGVLRALWLSAYNLGIVRNPDDRALLDFCERQTQLSHTRFLQDPRDAAKAVEALKDWIAREGGVVWPSAADAKRDGFHTLNWLRKKAVLDAVSERYRALEPLHDLDAFAEATALSQGSKFFAGLATMDGAFVDGCARLLGAKLRKKLAEATGKTKKSEAA
jgi:hypothetical protein